MNEFQIKKSMQSNRTKKSVRTRLFFLITFLFLLKSCSSGTSSQVKNDYPTPDENTKRVEKVISRNKDELDQCFKERKLKTPVLKGDVRVFLAENGKITNIKVINQNWKDPLLDRCIKQTVNAWSFNNVFIPQDLIAAHTFPVTYKK